MPSMKAIKRRIGSVNNIQQIMKAMNLVAASKVQRYKTRLTSIRPLFEDAKDFIETGVPRRALEGEHIYFKTFGEKTPPKKALYIVIAGERGLCGSYNASILRAAMKAIEDHTTIGEEHALILPIGVKSKEYFVRRKRPIVRDYTGVLEKVTLPLATEIAEYVNRRYLDGEIDEVYAVYTHFESMLTHEPAVAKLLPLSGDEKVPEDGSKLKDVIYEPDLATYLNHAVPVYLSMFMYGIMLEASVCEQASRMTSMDAASRNASEILEDLTLEYNRKRQGAITQEISEIVGGANAI